MKLYCLDTDVLKDTTLFAQYLSSVSEGRKQKVLSYKNDLSKRQSLGAGVLLDIALQTVGMREATANITVNEAGKPYLAQCTEFHFNLSHSGHYVLCAMDSSEVGCDIQENRAFSPMKMQQFAKRFYSEEERLFLLGLSESEQPDAFFALWTIKESFVKAVGSGLLIPTETFSALQSPIYYEGKKYFTAKQKWKDAYHIAVCTQNEISKLSVVETMLS